MILSRHLPSPESRAAPFPGHGQTRVPHDLRHQTLCKRVSSRFQSTSLPWRLGHLTSSPEYRHSPCKGRRSHDVEVLGKIRSEGKSRVQEASKHGHRRECPQGSVTRSTPDQSPIALEIWQRVQGTQGESRNGWRADARLLAGRSRGWGLLTYSSGRLVWEACARPYGDPEAASSGRPAPGPVGNWWEDRAVLLNSAWASRLGWSRSLPMCREDRIWSQSFADAVSHDNFLRTCYCSGADSQSKRYVVLDLTIPIPNPRCL